MSKNKCNENNAWKYKTNWKNGDDHCFTRPYKLSFATIEIAPLFNYYKTLLPKT